MPAPRSPFLTLVTDDTKPLDALADIVARACGAARSGGGTRIVVQLRWKTASGRDLWAGARRLRDVTRNAGVLFVVNDRIDVAFAADSDGAHLPAAGMASTRARRLLGEDKLLGRSVHSLEEIGRERAAGAADYVQFGPIFATPSKAQFGPAQGLIALTRAVERAGPLPVVAVGGITQENIASVMQTGARGAAVVGAVMSATDPAAAARALVRLVNKE